MRFTGTFIDCVYDVYENGQHKHDLIEVRRSLINRLPVNNILYKTKVFLIETKHNTYLIKSNLPFVRCVDGMIDRRYVYNQISNLEFIIIRQTDIEQLHSHKSGKSEFVDYCSAFEKINELVPCGSNVIFKMDNETD